MYKCWTFALLLMAKHVLTSVMVIELIWGMASGFWTLHFCQKYSHVIRPSKLHTCLSCMIDMP